MEKVYLLLGSNLNNRENNLSTARDAITSSVGKISNQSAIYETEPWGEENQDKFLNQAIEILTDKTPLDLLETIKSIESDIGRTPSEKWGPREIDIDILFYGNEMVSEVELTIPHPFVHERRFALMPLSEIGPDIYHPFVDMTVIDMLLDCKDESAVLPYKSQMP